MRSSTVVNSKEKREGLLLKPERMNEFFGGWHSLLWGRNGQGRKLKREKKIKGKNRLAQFGREFRGRSIIEPLK